MPQVRELWYRASLAWREVLHSKALRSCGLLVAHNAVNQALLCTALGLPPCFFRRFSQSNAAFTVLDFDYAGPGAGGGAGGGSAGAALPALCPRPASTALDWDCPGPGASGRAGAGGRQGCWGVPVPSLNAGNRLPAWLPPGRCCCRAPPPPPPPPPPLPPHADARRRAEGSQRAALPPRVRVERMNQFPDRPMSPGKLGKSVPNRLVLVCGDVTSKAVQVGGWGPAGAAAGRGPGRGGVPAPPVERLLVAGRAAGNAGAGRACL